MFIRIAALTCALRMPTAGESDAPPAGDQPGPDLDKNPLAGPTGDSLADLERIERELAAQQPDASEPPPQPGVSTLRPGRGQVQITVDGLLNIAGSLSGLLTVVAPGSQVPAAIAAAAPLVKAAQATLENVVLPELQRLFAAGRITAEQEAEVAARYEGYRRTFAERTAAPHWQQ